MLLPNNIKGRKRVRNAAICLDWNRLIDDCQYITIDSIQKALSEKFKLTERRILQIVRENYSYIPIDKEWEKKKRINRLKLEIKQKEKSNKDVADLLEQLRKEYEGEKGTLIDQSSHQYFTTIVRQIRQVLENDGKLDSNRIIANP